MSPAGTTRRPVPPAPPRHAPVFAAAAPPLAVVPDARLLFLVSLVTLLAVVLFSAAVIYLLLRRSYQRRVEEQKLAAMGTATARILHQIKNPLQTVLLHAELLQDPQVAGQPSTRREVCTAIISEAQRLAAMLDELSTYAAGARRRLALQPLALHELLRELADNEAREGQVRVDASGVSSAVVLADPYYFRQALENLIVNARDVMRESPEALLSLRLECRDELAAVEVADTGPGIPPERLPTIFEPFVSGKSKGMGLGLAICKEIVEGHGGRIEVQSRPGAGTVFRVLLPHHAGQVGAPTVTVQGGVS